MCSFIFKYSINVIHIFIYKSICRHLLQTPYEYNLFCIFIQIFIYINMSSFPIDIQSTQPPTPPPSPCLYACSKSSLISKSTPQRPRTRHRPLTQCKASSVIVLFIIRVYVFISYRYLEYIAANSSPVAMPLRMLEVFTDLKVYATATANKTQALNAVQSVVYHLIVKGALGMGILIDFLVVQSILSILQFLLRFNPLIKRIVLVILL